MEKKGRYILRLFDALLDFVSRSKSAIIVESSKWRIKSTTSKRYAKTIVDLMPLSTRQQLMDFVKVAIFGHPISL